MLSFTGSRLWFAYLSGIPDLVLRGRGGGREGGEGWGGVIS